MISDFYFTLAEAAEHKHVDRHTIWRWVRSGSLPAKKVGREVLILKEDLTRVSRSNSGRKPKEVAQ